MRRAEMDSEELIQLLKQVEDKGISREEVEEKTKIKYHLLDLYSRSGPVPVTLINNLKKILEEGAQ
jgi:hypothetical protein